MILIKRQRLSRRSMLRGAGASVALPLLDAMRPAAAAADKTPVRMAFVYVPNGMHMQEWTPLGVGRDFDLRRSMDPLRAVRDDLLVLTGLSQDNAEKQKDGPGDHARALAVFLTGARPKKTHGAGIHAGISVDQLAAQKVGHLTRLPSLEVGIEKGAQSGNCDSGYSCAYSSSLSWRTPTMPTGKEINPAVVFDRLFGDMGGAAADRRRQSLLDYVRGDLSTLRSKLGGSDRQKVDEYLHSVRDVEQRIARASTFAPVRAPAFGRPTGPPADYQEHIRLMADLLVAAFSADITRISTFLLLNESSNRSYPWLDIPDGHHELSHHAGDKTKHEKLVRINTWQVRQVAYFLEKLKSVKEGNGSLLDHSMIVFGSGISDGDRHNHDDLPVLLAGRGAGSFKTGRHLKFPKTPMNNLYLSMLDTMGAPVESFGDSTGRLEGLNAEGAG